ADPLVGCSAKENTLYITLRSRGPGAAERVRAATAGIHAAFPAELLTEGFAGDRLPRVEDVLGAELLARDVSITLAESCTGGGAAWLLTSVPGISQVFSRGYVTYSDAAKEAVLGVPHALLEEHGAVSGPVVAAMAEGALRAAGAQLALSISGVAGPGGGTPAKPVGTIWFGVHWAGRTWSIEHRYPAAWGRERLRAVSRRMALALGLRALRGQPLETAARR
ncbi:MAG: CinA family protein, partial [Planctomycetota bacterium]